MSRASRSRRLLIAMLAAATAVSALVAALNLSLAPALGAAAADALSRPLVDAFTLNNLPDGAPVVVEGTVSPRSTTLLRALVAYERREGSTLYEMAWGKRESAAAPFLLETAAGPLRITNGTYCLANPPPAPPDHTYGIQIGDPVAVSGAVARDAQGPALVAVQVVYGAWGGYVFGQIAAIALPVVATFAFASLLAALVTRRADDGKTR